ncbi:MAG: VacJ family lipoprotein [Candidatus Omnitrophica bacterium]|nr:VacJ family lipoprotein [Candidatus Omnitrophota bacterium]
MRKKVILFCIPFLFASLSACSNQRTDLSPPEHLIPPPDHVTVYYDNITPGDNPADQQTGDQSDSIESVPQIRTINDPYEPINRATFYFNDKIYRYGISPAGKVYEFLVPRVIRDRFHNFLDNLAFPRYFLSAIFQGKFGKSVQELNRFVINSTVGVGGLFDPATNLGFDPDHEDFGQALATYGLDHGFYLVLPLLGPTSGRDSVGLIFDVATDGKTYIQFINEDAIRGAQAFIQFNDQVMSVREYERMVDQEFDPYLIVRDLYYAYREVQVLK